MKKKEVPQDEGLMEGRFEDVCYALDENGGLRCRSQQGMET